MTAPEGLFEHIQEDVAAQILYAARVDFQSYIDCSVFGVTHHGRGLALPHRRRGLAKTLACRFLSPAMTAQWRRNKRIHGVDRKKK